MNDSLSVDTMYGDFSDQQRHLYAKHELMRHVAEDPSINAALKRIAKQSGIAAVAKLESSWSNLPLQVSIGQHIVAYAENELKITWQWFAKELYLLLKARLIGGVFGDYTNTPGIAQEDTRRRQLPDADIVRRNAVWFYRNRIKRPPDSLAALAREYHQPRHLPKNCPNCDDRKTVRDAIHEAERVLALTVMNKESQP